MKNKTVLVVDDEEVICKLLSTIFIKLHYNVIIAENGHRAIEIYKREHDNIDLAVIDLSMPKMSGLETLSRLKEIDSELIVLLSSGQEEMGALAQSTLDKADGFLNKPYRVEQLEEAIGAAAERRLKLSENRQS